MKRYRVQLAYWLISLDQNDHILNQIATNGVVLYEDQFALKCRLFEMQIKMMIIMKITEMA